MIKAAGSKDKYESLCQEENDVLLSAILQTLIIKLGQDASEEMPEDEKSILTLFICAGCGFHKNLNTVKGGYAAILQWWKNN